MLVASAIPAPKPAPSIPETAAQVPHRLAGRKPARGRHDSSPAHRLPQLPGASEQGAVVGVLSFSLELPRLATLFGRLQLPKGSVVALVDQRNLIVARRSTVEVHRVDARVAESRRRTAYHVDNDGVSRFHGTATIERGPWTLSVAIPRTEVLRRLAPLWRRNIVIMGLALVAVIGLALWISWQTAFTLRHLQQVAQRIAAGDFSPPQQRPVNSREMAQLQASFVTMARSCAARETLDSRSSKSGKCSRPPRVAAPGREAGAGCRGGSARVRRRTRTQ